MESENSMVGVLRPHVHRATDTRIGADKRHALREYGVRVFVDAGEQREADRSGMGEDDCETFGYLDQSIEADIRKCPAELHGAGLHRHARHVPDEHIAILLSIYPYEPTTR